MIIIIAILAIALLEGFAIWQNIDGAMLSIAFTLIAGLGGFYIGKTRKPK